MPKPNVCILVISKQQGCASYYEHLLQSDPGTTYQVSEAICHLESLCTDPGHPWDGILLETPLACCDFQTVLGRVRSQLGETSCPPIIILGAADVATAMQAVKAGAADYLVREQLTPEALGLALRTAITHTEQQRELQYREAQFHVSVESMQDCFGIFSALRDETGQIVDFRIDYLNDAACRNNQMTREQQLGRGLCEVLPGHRESGLFDEYCQLVETGEPLAKESLLYEDIYNGRRLVRAFDIRANQLNDGFVASWRDITEYKQLELALQEVNWQLEAALAAGSVYTWRWDVPTDRVTVNRDCAHLFGLAASTPTVTLPIASFLEAIHPADRASVTAAMAVAIAQQTAYLHEFRVCDRAGQEHWLIARGRVEYDAAGRPGIFRGTLADITQRKQAEAEHQRSEVILQALIAAAPIGLALFDRELRFLHANAALARIHGLPVSEHIGRPLGEVLPNLAPKAAPMLQQVMATQEPVLNLEFAGEIRPGVHCHTMANHFPVCLPDGEVIGVGITALDISELRQTERALQQATARLDMALKSAPIILFNHDRELRYTWIYKPTPHYPVEFILGKRDDELADAASAQRLMQLKQQVLDTGIGLREEVPVTLLGETVFYDLTIDPLWNERHELIGVTCAAVDITQRIQLETDRLQAQAQLAANEARLRGFVESNIIGINFSRIDGPIVAANDEFLRIIGYTRADLQAGGLRWDDLTPPEFLPLEQERIAEALERGACTPYEKEYRRPDGSRVPVLLAYSLVGENCEESVAFVLDLSDRKQAEMALRQSEDRLRLAIASAHMGTWDWHLGTNEIIWDAGCKAMFGLSPEVEPSMDLFYQALHPEDRPRLEQSLQQACESSDSALLDSVEYRIIRIDDQVERWIKATGQRYFDANGQLLRFVGVVLDITEQKHMEAQRAQWLQQEQAARAAAERANRIKDEFLAILSHELRSPLNPILGWASLLQAKQMNADITAQALSTIERNARLQTQLIDDLLDVSRILRGKLKLEMTAVDPVFVIEAALETVKAAAHAKGLSIQTDLRPVGPVRGDAGRLQQVVWNLLTNAVKFTPAGGRVEVQLVPVDQWAQIQVTDTGIGIRPEFLPHIFESFRQADTSLTRQHGGLGLGLAIVRYLVEDHGGIVTVDSSGEGQGATFTVKLPLLQAPAPHPPFVGQLTPGAVDLTGVRVLVVDDNLDTLELLTISLEKYGAEVQALDQAAAVFQHLETFQPDLLICDIGMPEMDGFTVIQQIRSSPSAQRAVPAIALTAYVRDQDRQKALSQGFQRHMAKPVEPHQLALAVAQMCHKI